MSFSFASIPQKKGLSPFLLQIKKYFYPLLFVNFQPLIRIDNCIPINNIKGVRFGIRDTCKNWEKENFGKDRYKRECSEGNEGIEYEDTTQDFKN